MSVAKVFIQKTTMKNVEDNNNEDSTITSYCLHCRKPQQQQQQLDSSQTTTTTRDESNSNKDRDKNPRDDSSTTTLPLKLLTCSRCKLARYCSRKCQKLNFSLHKDPCKRIAEMHEKIDKEYPDEFKNLVFHENNNNKNPLKGDDSDAVVSLLSILHNQQEDHERDMNVNSQMIHFFLTDTLNLANQIVNLTYVSTDIFQRGHDMYQVALDYFLTMLSLLLPLTTEKSTANLPLSVSFVRSSIMQVFECIATLLVARGTTQNPRENEEAFTFIIYGYRALSVLLPSPLPSCHSTTDRNHTVETSATQEASPPPSSSVSPSTIRAAMEDFGNTIDLLRRKIPCKKWTSKSLSDDYVDQVLPGLFQKRKKNNNSADPRDGTITEQGLIDPNLVSLGALVMLAILYMRQLVPVGGGDAEDGTAAIGTLSASTLVQHNKSYLQDDNFPSEEERRKQDKEEDDDGVESNGSKSGRNLMATPTQIDDSDDANHDANITTKNTSDTIMAKYNLKRVLSVLNSKNPLLPRFLLDKIPFHRNDCLELYYEHSVDERTRSDDDGQYQHDDCKIPQTNNTPDQQQQLNDMVILPPMDNVYWYILQDILFLSPGVSTMLDDYYPEQYD